jgi:hypothetical protein
MFMNVRPVCSNSTNRLKFRHRWIKQAEHLKERDAVGYRVTLWARRPLLLAFPYPAPEIPGVPDAVQGGRMIITRATSNTTRYVIGPVISLVAITVFDAQREVGNRATGFLGARFSRLIMSPY